MLYNPSDILAKHGSHEEISILHNPDEILANQGCQGLIQSKVCYAIQQA